MGLLSDILSYVDSRKRVIGDWAKNPDVLWSQINEDARDFRRKHANRGLLSTQDLEQTPEWEMAMNAPFGLLGMFAGVGAKTANKTALETAQKMAKSGTDPVDVWKATGWTDQFPDGKWRFEIPDDTAKVKDMFGPNFADNLAQEKTGKRIFDLTMDERKPFIDEGARLEKEYFKNPDKFAEPVTKYVDHPSLFQSYPEASNIRVGQQWGANLHGSFDERSNIIRYGGGPLGVNKAENKSTMLHELQHAIQHREDFARGGSPEEFTVGKWLMPESERLKAIDEVAVKRRVVELMERAKERGTTATEELQRESNVWGFDTGSDRLRELLTAYGDDLESARKWYLHDKNKLDEYTKMAILDPHEHYRRLAGETEARLTQSRMNLTPAERAARPPWLEFDVPREHQIVHGLLGR